MNTPTPPRIMTNGELIDALRETNLTDGQILECFQGGFSYLEGNPGDFGCKPATQEEEDRQDALLMELSRRAFHYTDHKEE